MQSVEDFIHDFFRALILEEKREVASRAPFREKFYAPECDQNSRAGTSEKYQSMAIVSVTSSESKAAIVVTFKNVYYKPGNQIHREKYHLKKSGATWLVELVELECPACHGKGDASCIFCEGKHWR